MAVSVTNSGAHRPTIKVPATPRVVATIRAPIHPAKGAQNPAHMHIKIPKSKP